MWVALGPCAWAALRVFVSVRLSTHARISISISLCKSEFVRVSLCARVCRPLRLRKCQSAYVPERAGRWPAVHVYRHASSLYRQYGNLRASERENERQDAITLVAGRLMLRQKRLPTDGWMDVEGSASLYRRMCCLVGLFPLCK